MKKSSTRAAIRYDAHGFIINGRREFLIGGEFHYFRTPHELWEDRLIKMKRAGANFVATYIPWNWHEPREGEELWSGNHDLRRFIELSAEHGLYMVLKPGPYICAEWDFGGYPDWILGKKIPLRVLDERHMKYVDRWYRKVAEVINPYLITNGGNVICVQVENEYDHLMRLGEEKISVRDAVRYFMRLARIMDKYGINVPKFANEAEFLHGRGIIDTRTYYPNIPWIWMWEFNYFDEKILKARKGQPDCPTMILELQSGWFSQFGQPYYIPEVELTESVSKTVTMLGASFLNYYMFVGGTTFPFWGCRGDRSAHPQGQLESVSHPIGTTTTFDFGGSPVREWGELMPGRYDWLRAFAHFTRDYSKFLMSSELVSGWGVLGGGEDVQVIDDERSRPDSALESAPENFKVIARGRTGQYLLCIRNLGETTKKVTIGRKRPRRAVFEGLEIGPRETRLLPVNLQIPGTRLRIVRSTSEPLFVRRMNGRVVFGLYGRKGCWQETVLDVPASEVRPLSRGIQVADEDGKAVLLYRHEGVQLIQVGQHNLLLLEHALAGKVDEFEHGLLVADAYFVRDAQMDDDGLNIVAQVRNGASSSFHFIGGREAVSARIDGRPVSLRRKSATGLTSFTFRQARTRPVEVEWLGGWKTRSDSREAAPQYADDDWRLLRCPQSLEEVGLLQHGYIWYRMKFDLPRGAREVHLHYPGNDIDHQRVFVNGKEVWNGITRMEEIDISSAVRSGTNVIAVLYRNFFHNKAHPSEGPIMKYSGIMEPIRITGVQAGRRFTRKVSTFRVQEGLGGLRAGYHRGEYDDRHWTNVPAARRYVKPADTGIILWMRRRFRYRVRAGWEAPLRIVLPQARERCLLYVNDVAIGHFEPVGPQHEFYVPEPLLKEENLLAVVLEGTEGYLDEPLLEPCHEVREVHVRISFA